MGSSRRVLRGAGVALAGLLGLTVVACGSGGPPATSTVPGTDDTGTGDTTVTVAYVPVPLFGPLFVAMNRGYFAQHHLTIQLTDVTAGQDAITLAATDKVQVVLGGFSAGMFNAVNTGLDFTVVGSMAGEPDGQAADGLVLSSALRGRVNNPGDLKGMKVAVNGGPGAAGGYLLAQALAPYHLTLADVTPVNLALPEQADALRSGAVAAALMSSPFLTDTVNSGVGTLIAQAAPGASVTGVIYSKEFATTPAAQEFFDALAEGAQDLQGDRASAPDNLQIEADATHQSLDVLEHEPANVFDPRLAPPTATLEAMQQVYLQSGMLGYQTPIPSSRYVDGEFSARVPTR